MRQVYAVATGCSVVQFTNPANHKHANYWLDNNISAAHSWSSLENKIGVWIQVSCQQPKYWTDVIIQGRGDYDSWVTSFKVSSTLTGKLWQNAEEGKVYQGNTDNNQKVRVKFAQPIYARTIRLYPQTWKGQISLRFDAVFLDLNDY